jgi:hypothetical protein
LKQKNKASLGQKFDKIVGQVWFKDKNLLFMSKMKDLISMQ